MKQGRKAYNRIMATLLAIILAFESASFTGLNELSIVRAATTEDVFSDIVKKNISEQLKYDSDTITETGLALWQAGNSKCFPSTVSYTLEEITAAINAHKTAEGYYTDVKVADIMTTLLGNGKYVFYTMDQDNPAGDITTGSNYEKFVSVNTAYSDGNQPKEGEPTQADLATANPWSTKVIGYSSTPLSPGVDYSGQSMNDGYTVGQLIVDYFHATYSPSGLLADAKIIEIYNIMASDAGSPYVDVTMMQQNILAAVNASSIGGSSDQSALSVLNTDNMLTYQNYVLSLPADQPIPAGTLFIGTWMMDAKSVTEPFYRMALQSMTDYNQQNMLYKSELSSGYWKNIYGASGLDDILPVSDNVEESEMKDYYVDIVVGADGIPRRALGGAEVDVFSLVNPYELDTLPELRSLKAMYDGKLVSPTDQNRSNQYIYYRLQNFFKADQPYIPGSTFKEDCDYIFHVASTYHMAYYAEDVRSGRRLADSPNGENGRVFLNSLELAAENDSFGERFWYYNWNGHGGYSGKQYYMSKIIRGDVSWDGEKAFREEVKRLSGGSDSNFDTFNRASQSFRTVFRHATQIQDDVTRDADRRLEGVKGLYKALCQTGDAEDKELAYMAINVEDSIDSLRRYEAYYNLVENENINFYVGPPLMYLYECVTEGKTSYGVDFTIQWYTTENFTPDDAVTAAVENAIVSCTESMYEYQQRALNPGTTIASQTKYDLSNTIIDNASNGIETVRPTLRQLLDLDNITKNVIAHKSRELSMVTNTLLPTADTKFVTYLHQGVGAEYRQAASYSTTTQNALDEILKDQKAGVSSVAAELQSFIKARAMRLSTEEAIAFVNERINRAESLRSGITDDPFRKYAEEALDDHIRWLQDLLATVAEGGDLDDDGTDYAYAIDSFETDLLDALNNGDLEAAAAVERKLKETARDAEDDEKNKRNTINDPNASAADKVNASDVNTPTGMADKIYNDAKDKISDNDWGNLSDDIEALADLGSPKLPDLLAELEAKNAPANLIHKTQQAIQDSEDSDFKERYGNSNSGNNGLNNDNGDRNDGGGPQGTGDSNENNYGGDDTGGGVNGSNGDLNINTIDMAIEDAFGHGTDELTPNEAAATIAALSAYGDVHGDNSELNAAVDDLLNRLIAEHNPFLYRQYLEDQSREYVSLAAVSRARRYTKFRLVEKDGLSTMTQIAGGSASYGFEVGSSGVVKNNGGQEKMDTVAVSQEDEYIYGSKTTKYPYINEEASGKYMYCTCTYIENTEWAVLITPVVDKKIALLLDMLDAYADKKN